MNPEASAQFSTILRQAVQLAKAMEADALVVMLEGKGDWELLKKKSGKLDLIVAADDHAYLEDAEEAGITTLQLNMEEAAVSERLTQALLQAVAAEMLPSGADVVAIFSAFEAETIDTVSFISLDEHLGKLSARDLRILKTKVPLETLKVVLDLAIEIGREGREGKPVGTIFVVGDTKKVLQSSTSLGFDPVRGYGRKERNLHDRRVREAVKEFCQLDGAIIVSPDGTVDAACRLLDVTAASITLSKGLGARHGAAAAITKKTNAISFAISESNGTVRIFQNGEVMLRVEPFRRAMKWKDFDIESPPSSES